MSASTPETDWVLTLEESEAMVAVAGNAGHATDSDALAYWKGRIGPEAVRRARERAEALVEGASFLGGLALLADALCRRHHLTGLEIDEILNDERTKP